MQHFDQEREIREQSENDWRFGAISRPCLAFIPVDLREQYLPKGEVQRAVEDTQSCASFSPVNILAAKFTYACERKLFLPENIKWLEDNGYLVDGRVDFSDAYVAINSGTTRSGNSLKAPLEAIRKQGLIPKAMLPLESWMTFDAFHNPARITSAMRALGTTFSQRFIINYEQVNSLHFNEAMQDDFLDVGLHGWPFPENGIYQRTDNPFNHATMLYKPRFYAFDTYLDEGRSDDYIKNLAPDYAFFTTGYRVYISAEGQEIVTLYQTLVKLLIQLRDLIAASKLKPAAA